MNLSEHFTLEELVASDIAARTGIDNTPDVFASKNLSLLAEALESVRAVLGNKRIHINSGFRCLRVNGLLGSKTTSAHVSGLAADLTCAEFGTPLEICQAIRNSGIAFDQVIYEFGAWCHFAIAHQGLKGRQQVLTIDKTGTREGLGD